MSLGTDTGTAASNLCAADRGGRSRLLSRDLLCRLLPLLLMLAALAVIFRRLIAGWVLAGGDLHLYFYPHWVEVARELQAGRVPVWNPYLFAGVPLLANSQVGLFYPLNWPFWLLFPALPASMAAAIHWSVVLHVAIAATTLYAVLRRMGLSAWPAALGGLIYGGSGFVGVHVEHLNQLQALAWLPLLFLPRWTGYPRSLARGLPPRFSLPRPASIAAMAMILLAGHTQMAFIAAVGLIVWALISGGPVRCDRDESRPGVLFRSLFGWVVALAPFLLAVAVAAVQLVPTLELVQHSGRSGGLPWREAISFSLAPGDIPKALLPPTLVSLQLPEGVGTVGLLALAAAALGAYHVVISRARKDASSRTGLGWLALSGAGLLGALGGYNPAYLLAVRLGIPGFAHFRAPARFLALFVLGSAALAALACEWLIDDQTKRSRTRPNWVASGVLWIALIAGITVELCVCAEYLPHADATTARAYTDLRPATADLLGGAMPKESIDTASETSGRFLSISQALFEVGDRAEIESAYGSVLPADALRSYLVASKHREILTPNLSLVYRVPAVDGYDGGLLPTKHFIAFTKLLLEGGTIDGRLRENLSAIPEQRWLDLLGVVHLVTDKTSDTWVEGVLYDRQFQPMLSVNSSLQIAWLPMNYEADTLSLLYEGEGAVGVDLADGRNLSFELPSRSSSSDDYRLTWEDPAIVSGVVISATEGPIRLSAGSLIDHRLSTFYPIVLSDAFRLVHSGDVKIYESTARDTGPRRAFLVHQSCSADTDSALMVMENPAFDPARSVVLAGENTHVTASCAGQGIDPAPAEWARVVDDRGDALVIDVHSLADGYLVVADAWYPGWQATLERLNGTAEVRQEAVQQADVMFRAVPIPPGLWRVTLSYESRSVVWGTAIAGIGLAALGVYAWGSARYRSSADVGASVAQR